MSREAAQEPMPLERPVGMDGEGNEGRVGGGFFGQQVDGIGSMSFV